MRDSHGSHLAAEGLAEQQSSTDRHLASDLSYQVFELRRRRGELTPPAVNESSRGDELLLMRAVALRRLYDPDRLPETRVDAGAVGRLPLVKG